MSNSLQLAHQWWATLDQADRQRVWDARHSYLASDLVESLAKAGVPVVSDGRWSCVSVGPTGFTVPIAVQQLLEWLSQIPNGDSPPGNASGNPPPHVAAGETGRRGAWPGDGPSGRQALRP